MMPAAPGNRRPAQDGVDRLAIGELAALELRPWRSKSGRSPDHLAFQMVSWVSKSRKLERAARSMPSRWAASRIARNEAAAS